jgi:hypothetical protein
MVSQLRPNPWVVAHTTGALKARPTSNSVKSHPIAEKPKPIIPKGLPSNLKLHGIIHVSGTMMKAEPTDAGTVTKE